MSLGELRGNEGKIPATVQPPIGRENVNAVALKSEEVYQNSFASFPTSRPSHNGSLESSALDQVTKEEESGSSEQIVKEGRMDEAEKVTGVIQPSDLPPKKTDPGVFTLPISIRDVLTEQAMCDLGASINVMPYSMYEKLGEAKLVETDMVIQLANGSCIYPEGILENEVVKVNKFMYLADFFVIKMTEPGAEESVGILLGRPFLSTASTLIDVRHGTMSLEFNGERLTVDINAAARKPQDSGSVQSVETVEPLEQRCLEREPFIKPPSDSTDDEKLMREAADWFEATITGEMDDEAIEKTIMDFCKPTRPAKTEEITQPGRIEELPDQTGPLRRELKENPALTRQLLPPPESPIAFKNLSSQECHKPVNPSLQEQEGQSRKKLRPGEEEVKWRTEDLMEINPTQYMHPASVEKGAISPSSRKEEPSGEQKELPFQNQNKLISRKRNSEWTDSHATMALHTLEANMHQEDPSNSFSFVVKSDQVDPYGDKIEAGMVEGIPLILPNLN